MVTAQVKYFQEVAKRIGLVRGDYRARSPKDKHGEYRQTEICIFALLTEEQTRELAKDYDVTVYKRDGAIGWGRPSVSVSGSAGITLLDLDNRDEYGIYKMEAIV